MRTIDFFFRGRRFQWTMGMLGLALWGLLIWFRPEFLVENGSLLFALAAVGGGFFVVFLADEKTWVRNYLLAAALLQVAFSAVCLAGVFWWSWPKAWLVLPLAPLLLSQGLLTLLVRGEVGMPSVPSPGATKTEFSATKRFYEVYWFVLTVFGVTCDVLDHLAHRYHR